jgi:2-phosphosulfolactate phosphatase
VRIRAGELDKAVYCGCLRNLSATAAACGRFASVLIVPCGERWPDSSLRPCIEDYLAAGGIVSKLGRGGASPEARVAAQPYEHSAGQRGILLANCESAKELVGRGFAADVELCLEVDTSPVACRLDGEGYVAETLP